MTFSDDRRGPSARRERKGTQSRSSQPPRVDRADRSPGARGPEHPRYRNFWGILPNSWRVHGHANRDHRSDGGGGMKEYSAASPTKSGGFAKLIRILVLEPGEIRLGQWLLENRDRTDSKNSIEDLAIHFTCDHDYFGDRIKLLGCFAHLTTRSVRQLQVQKHEIEFLLPEAFNGLSSRTDRHSTEADLFQKCSKEIPQTQIVVDY